MKIPTHDFASSFALAQTDRDLRNQLVKYYGTNQLSPPSKSDLVASTVNVMTWVIQDARSLYWTEPERLVGAISGAMNANALAVWSSSGRDWIVLSEGLMELLRGGSDSLANRFANTFPELMESDLMKSLNSQPPLPGKFQTTLGSFLYFSAIAFFVGHEAGHHLAGHDGFYVHGAHAEHPGDLELPKDDAWLIKHALEREADLYGLDLSRRAATMLLGQLWEVKSFSANERRDYQRILAALIGTGTLTAALQLVPRKIEWHDLSNRAHPPSTVRILTLAASLSKSIKESFFDLDNTYRRWIRQMSLELAVGATVRPGTDIDQIYQERLARGGEPAAIRATGIRKALHDPEFRQYNMWLKSALDGIRPMLKPRNRPP